MNRTTSRRAALFVLLLVVFVMSAPRAAWAHANLLSSNPPQGAVVKEAPAQLTLDFSEALEPDYIDLQLYDAAGQPIPVPAVHLQKGKASTMVAELPPLTEGSYSVVYSILSEDGHPVSETYTFSVGTRTAVMPPMAGHDHNHGTDTGTDASSGTADASRLHDLLLLVLRYAVETLLLLGAGLYALAAYAARTGMPGWHDLLGRTRMIAWVVLLLGTVAEWFVYAAAIPGGRLTSDLLSGRFDVVAQSPFALMVLVQLVLLLLLAVPSMTGGWYAAIWTLLVANLAIGGHAMALTPLWGALTLRIVHLLTIAAWLGALTYLLLALPWQKRHAAEGHAIDRARFRAFFLRVVAVAAALVAVTGIVMVAQQSGWSALFGSLSTGAMWRNLLFAKIGLMLLMLVIALLQNKRWRGDEQHELSYNLVRLEWLAGFLIIQLGVWISQLPYPGT